MDTFSMSVDMSTVETISSSVYLSFYKPFHLQESGLPTPEERKFFHLLFLPLFIFFLFEMAPVKTFFFFTPAISATIEK